MNILILGYGLEGKSVESFFKSDPSLSEHTKIEILDSFTKEELLFKDFSNYDLIFRTPSVPPKFIPAPPEKITSVTKYFFHNCPCPIIGATGTKGKGTTCTMIRALLAEQNVASRRRTAGYDRPAHWDAARAKPDDPASVAPATAGGHDSRPTKETLAQASRIYLVGNIGTPALDILPDLTENDLVVYELSSFQLWDLDRSPNISVVLRIEPDHLDVHDSFAEYLEAKQNIVKFQSKTDFCVYFKHNEHTKNLVKSTNAERLPYPLEAAETPPELSEILSALHIPGDFNKENLEAALLASFAFLKTTDRDLTFDNFLKAHKSELKTTASNFSPLPHHLEFVRELNGVKYYDDSFSTVFPSLEAALDAFPNQKIVLLAGGKDKGFDLAPAKRKIFDHPNLVKAVLIGETAEKLSDNEDPEKYFLAETDFELAIKKAQAFAEAELEKEEENSDTCLVDKKPEVRDVVVLLSPCASSFDMFESYKARGDIFKRLVSELN